MDNEFKVIRQSLIEWCPVNGTDCMLIINEPEGFMDELMSKRCSVTSADSYEDVLSICNRKEQFDIILMYDLYGFALHTGNSSLETLLSTLLSLKREGGRLLLALENKLGMKYWAGCQEEQKGGYYIGIEDYKEWTDKIKPLSKKELEEVLQGFDDISYKFYYPYPDYKYPTIIYTDECLPSEGELFRNNRNIDRERYIVIDETKAYDSVIKAGLFAEFSNSYLISIV
ncbi:MAG TPA: hypothetical protein DCR12_01525 [Lachnospiraceae bacterium]|nr:hypothetical protein [Lachnospiraceae bacterium]